MATSVHVANPDDPENRQQAILVATKEARQYRGKRIKLLVKDGIPAPTHQQCLGKLVVPFGQYENAPFHWLVSNDVGYMKYIIDKHRAEVTNKHKNAVIVNQWVKDYLTEYAESFPQVSSLLEANIDRCIYGQRGFESHTFKEMWELYYQYSTLKNRPELFTDEKREIIQKAYTSVRRWLHTPLTHIISMQMKRFKKYINEKEQTILFPLYWRASLVATSMACWRFSGSSGLATWTEVAILSCTLQIHF
ncbi:hypothetical protein Q7C36_004540 [Tachysurus vachellii]|uniref:Uncharacterized protein n=1 Tax=Tachysurus vachellii TaxID=175792 RepID=A0AA88TB47_TACVA|nr:hypothetical protein Q7C36_004540 [Tachysurus vachellii]